MSRSVSSVFFLVLVLKAIISSGSPPTYSVSLLDSSLLKNAAMVIRLNEVNINIKSLGTVVIKQHYVVTILKESASKEAVFTSFYNNYSSVDDIEGSMYDKYGVLIKTFYAKDISDESAIPNGVLYSDARLKTIRAVPPFYPVTLDFYSERTIRKIIPYPDFLPQNKYEQGVETARLVITAKEGLFPRFKEVRFPSTSRIEGDGITYKKWEFSNLKPVPEEPLGPALEQQVPVIYLSPSTYSMKEYRGDFSSWQSFGNWMKSLSEGRDSLPSDIISAIRQKVSGITNEEEKVSKIYDYLKRSTRYVAVEVGIGGWQPDKASTVAKLGYGDCKGLVNYACALLKYAGIPSWLVLINGGDPPDPVQEDFPGNQFNHAILCVPIEKDTVWLECTSQINPFGFLGSFTDNRPALLVGPDGGKLVHTPGYSKTDNTVVRKTRISPDPSGSSEITLDACYRGQLYELYMDDLYLSNDKQREQLLERFDLPGLKIDSYSCQSEGTKIPSFSEALAAHVSGLVTVSGNRMFIPINRLGNATKNFVKNDSRYSDLVLRNTYCIIDSVTVDIPPDYSIESKPAPTELKTEFGSLTTVVRDLGSKIIFIRRFEGNNGTFPPSAYNDFAEFMRQVSRQDNKKLVLIKK